MQYSDFIKQPKIAGRFNSMFEKQIEYFKRKISGYGIKGERVNIVAIKMASVSTDIYFSTLHNRIDKE